MSQITTEILRQLGGNKFIAMAGAQCYSDGENTEQIIMNSCYGINHIHYTLNKDLIESLQNGLIAIKPTKCILLLNAVIKYAFPRINGQFSGACYYMANYRDKDLCEFAINTNLPSVEVDEFLIFVETEPIYYKKDINTFLQKFELVQTESTNLVEYVNSNACLPISATDFIKTYI